MIWSFDIGIKLMIKQILLGFELNLYVDFEYHIIFYILDHLYSLLDRNTRSFISRFDKDFLKAWQSKQGLDKKKKKLTDFQRKYFYDNLVNKAIESYIRSMLKLTYSLIRKGYIKDYYGEDKDALEKRFCMRLKIFENVFFIRKIEFADFTKLINEVVGNDVSIN